MGWLTNADVVKTDDAGHKYPDYLEVLAEEAEVEALKKRDEWLEKVVAEHQSDASAYKFECRRWGDFLSLFMERLAPVRWDSFERQPSTYATSVNLRETRELRLVKGHPADGNGILKYHVGMVLRGADGEWQGSCSWSGRSAPTKGWRAEVTPQYPYLPVYRQMFMLDPKSENNRCNTISYGQSDNYDIKRSTPFARLASDDTIRFEGVGATLYVPAGRGQEIYDALLGEIERSSPSDPASPNHAR